MPDVVEPISPELVEYLREEESLTREYLNSLKAEIEELRKQLHLAANEKSQMLQQARTFQQMLQQMLERTLTLEEENRTLLQNAASSSQRSATPVAPKETAPETAGAAPTPPTPAPPQNGGFDSDHFLRMAATQMVEDQKHPLPQEPPTVEARTVVDDASISLWQPVRQFAPVSHAPSHAPQPQRRQIGKETTVPALVRRYVMEINNQKIPQGHAELKPMWEWLQWQGMILDRQNRESARETLKRLRKQMKK
jgi:hypothetical protein